MSIVNDVCTWIGRVWSMCFLILVVTIVLAAISGRVRDRRTPPRDPAPGLLRDELTAIVAALQDGRVNASQEVCEVVHLALHELELDGAA